MHFPWVLPPLLFTLQLNIWIPLYSLEVERGLMGSQNHIYEFFSTTVLSSLLSTYADSQLHVPISQFWRRQWQPTPVLLPGRSHGPRNLVGYSPWGRKESDMTSLSLSMQYLAHHITPLIVVFSIFLFILGSLCPS